VCGLYDPLHVNAYLQRGKSGFPLSHGEHTIAILYLSVSVDDGSEELPGAAPAVHSDHAEDLEEAEAAQGGGGEHLAVGRRQHDDGGTHGYHI